MRYNDSRKPHVCYFTLRTAALGPRRGLSASQPLSGATGSCRAGGLPWINQDATSVYSSGPPAWNEAPRGLHVDRVENRPRLERAPRASRCSFSRRIRQPTDLVPPANIEFSDSVSARPVSAGGSHSNINSGHGSASTERQNYRPGSSTGAHPAFSDPDLGGWGLLDWVRDEATGVVRWLELLGDALLSSPTRLLPIVIDVSSTPFTTRPRMALTNNYSSRLTVSMLTPPSLRLEARLGHRDRQPRRASRRRSPMFSRTSGTRASPIPPSASNTSQGWHAPRDLPGETTRSTEVRLGHRATVALTSGTAPRWRAGPGLYSGLLDTEDLPPPA